MAWIQHILLWVTVMSSSAYNYKHHSSFVLQSPDYGIYPEQSYHESISRAAGIQPDQINERSMSIRSPAQYIHDDRRRGSTTPQRTTPLAENGSYRIVNDFTKRSPAITSRRGEIVDSAKDRVVFPGPISRRQYEPEVPEECKKIGICEEVPNYPEEHVANIIANLKVEEKKRFPMDELDVPDIPNIAQRAGAPEETMELCKFREKLIHPQAATDINDKWYTVINPKDSPIQGFKVEICDTNQPSYAKYITFQPGYEGKCVQKYVRRTMAVLGSDGNITDMALKLPSCCSCVATLKL